MKVPETTWMRNAEHIVVVSDLVVLTRILSTVNCKHALSRMHFDRPVRARIGVFL